MYNSRNATQKNIQQSSSGWKMVTDIRLADDQPIMGNSDDRMQRIKDSLNTTSKEYGMKIILTEEQNIEIQQTQWKNENSH